MQRCLQSNCHQSLWFIKSTPSYNLPKHAHQLYYNQNAPFASSHHQKKKARLLEDPKILEVEGISKIIARDKNRLYLFNDISFQIHSSMKIGLLGNNGTGKSTLMKILGSRDNDYEGKVIKHYEHLSFLTGGGSTGPLSNALRVGYLEQEPQINGALTIFEAVTEGLEYVSMLQKRWETVVNEMADPLCDIDSLMMEQDYIEQRLDFLGGWNIEDAVTDSCRNLKCPEDLQRKISTLSGGELRRVALAKLLLSNPDMLLLDEPTNHLDITSVEWLERHIQEFKGSVMTVSHDRVFLEATSNTIMELDQGKVFMHYGLYSDWIRKRATISFTSDKTHEKIKKTIEREHIMLTKGQKGLKSRINKIKELEKQLKEGEVIPFIGYEPRLLIPQGAILNGNFVMNVQDLTYIHPESERCFFKKLSFSLKPGMVVGIVGPNGIGKTTLFKLIVGKLQPTSGHVHINSGVQLGYIDQSRQALNPLNKVWEEILEGHDIQKEIHIHENKKIAAREYVRQFNFEGKSQDKMVSFLSGGERNRVHLAKSLRNGCNLLLLDEPSNDLDVDTVRKLEECLETFRGCAMVVSHDRYFLDRVCTHLIAFESFITADGTHDTKVQWYEGNYSEYLTHKHYMQSKHYKRKMRDQEMEDNINKNNDVVVPPVITPFDVENGLNGINNIDLTQQQQQLDDTHTHNENDDDDDDDDDTTQQSLDDDDDDSMCVAIKPDLIVHTQS